MEQSQEIIQNIPSSIINKIKIPWFRYTYIILLLFFLIGIGSFLAGRSSIQQNTNIILSPTIPTITIDISQTITSAPNTPTLQTGPTCFASPVCLDVIPKECTRSPFVYDNNGCLVSCGQLQCEPPHQPMDSQ